MKRTIATIVLIGLAVSALAGRAIQPKVLRRPSPPAITADRVLISGSNWYFLSGNTVTRIVVPRGTPILRRDSGDTLWIYTNSEPHRE